MQDIEWDVLDKYFLDSSSPESKNILIKHQISSYNKFLETTLNQIITGFNPLKINHNNKENSDYINKININVLNPTLGRPVYQLQDGTQNIMTPYIARMNNLTYASSLSVDVHVVIEVLNKNGVIEKAEKNVNNVFIGKIPIMVKSNACILTQMQGLGEVDNNECRYDLGGYFIVNGNEKCIISQDRINENKTLIFQPANNNDGLYAEIRSMNDNIYLPPKTTSLFMSNKLNYIGRIIRLNASFLRNDVPVFIMFRALGVLSDKEIIQHIVYDIDDKNNQRIINELMACCEDASDITTKEEAENVLIKSMTGANKSNDPLGLLHNNIINDFLPHVGKSYRKKALYIGYMVRKMIRIYLGYDTYDNRDSYMNKRIDTPGILMSNLFRQCYGKMTKEMKILIEKELSVWKVNQNTPIIDIISNNNIYRYFKQSLLDSWLKYALATGNWGIKSIGSFQNIRQGVSQVLNRMSYSSTLSHLRRINTAMEKNGKLVQPRKLDSSQFGMICPAETPEGASVGLVKNMALSTQISILMNSCHIRQILKELDVKHYDDSYTTETENFLKELGNKNNVYITVNGDIIGYHNNPIFLYEKLKHYKRCGIIYPMTGIIWNIKYSFIQISTEAGRMFRPLFIVENKELRIAKILREKQMTFKEYVKNKSFDSFVCPSLFDSSLDLNEEGFIEYLDSEEINHHMIAINPNELTKGIKGTALPPLYTHCEIHASLINGVLGVNIPFSDHNQSPRNCYQCAMGKQALGIYATNFNKRIDTMGSILNYPQLSLVQTKTSKYTFRNLLPSGINAIVAIMTHTGFNQEDSVMINKSAIDRGLFVNTYYKAFKDQCIKNHSTGEEEEFIKPENISESKPYSYDKLDKDGFVPKNVYVSKNDIIVGKVMPKKTNGVITRQDNSVCIKANDEGYIDWNYTDTNGEGYKFCKIRIRKNRSPDIGDKLACYSKDHEYLTEKGWVSVEKLTTNDKVASLVNNKLVYQYPSKIYKFDYCGKMYNVETPNFNLTTTPNHRMYYSLSDNKWQIDNAEDIINKTRYKFKKSCDDWFPDYNDVDKLEYLNKTFKFNEDRTKITHYIFNIENNQYIIHIDNWINIYGTSINEYWVNIKNNYKIAQLANMFNNIVLTDDTDNKMLYKKIFKFYLNKILDNQNVYLEDWVWYLNKEQSKKLLETICVDNSEVIDKNSWKYYTKHNLFADQLQILSLHSGYSCNIIYTGNKNNSYLQIYTLYINKKEVNTYINNNKRKTNYQDKWISYEGYVYCCTVPQGEGIIYVRKNGKGVWSGNSTAAQKGTIGMAYNHQDMPFTKQGIVPDIIMNPHAIPSRMTIGQLMETIMGKACCHLGSIGDATPFNGCSVEDIAQVLELSGLERYGNEILYDGRTGEQIKTEIFIGPTYYQRLKHMVADKVHSRGSNGPIVMLTHQSSDGRVKHGGLRLGEMERDCLVAHGISSFSKERMLDVADNYRVFICKNCGLIANVNVKNNIYQCKVCSNNSDISQIRIPYAFKLLSQELLTMNILMRFITK